MINEKASEIQKYETNLLKSFCDISRMSSENIQPFINDMAEMITKAEKSLGYTYENIPPMIDQLCNTLETLIKITSRVELIGGYKIAIYNTYKHKASCGEILTYRQIMRGKPELLIVALFGDAVIRPDQDSERYDTYKWVHDQLREELKTSDKKIDIAIEFINNLLEYSECIESLSNRETVLKTIHEAYTESKQLDTRTTAMIEGNIGYISSIEFYEPDEAKHIILLREIAKNLYSVIRKSKKPGLKIKSYASIPTSLTSNELTKEHIPEDLNRSERVIMTKKKYTKAGCICFGERVESIDPYSNDMDSEILSNYSNIGLSREELQIYFALIDTYITNVRKSDYGKSYEISTKDFHNKVMGRSNRIREDDLKWYISKFSRLSCKRIRIETSGAEKGLFKKKEFKNCIIDDNIISVAVMTDSEYTDQVISITPTKYMLFELKQVKQISNFFPKEFITLDFKKNPSILYFGFYLTRMHRANETTLIKDDKKNKNGSDKYTRIHNTSLAKEFSFKTLVESLPYGNKIIEEYKTTERKKQYIEREVLKPLTEAVKIMIDRGYIHKNTNLLRKDFIDGLNYRRIFDEDTPNINLIFNYDNGKLISLE